MNNAIPRQNDLNIAAILDDHRWTLRCIFITGCTLSVCVFGRSLYEQHKRKGLGWNNAVIGLSLVFAVVMQVLAAIPVRTESQFIAATAAFVLSKSLSTTYVLLLLRCIGFQVMRPILTYPTIVVVAVAIIANVLGVAAPLVGCVITETASEASCHPMKPVFLAAIAFDIFKGIWLFTLSAYQVHQLRNSLGPKILLLAYLFLGLTSTCVRVYVLVEIASPHNDLTRDVAAGITWSVRKVSEMAGAFLQQNGSELWPDYVTGTTSSSLTYSSDRERRNRTPLNATFLESQSRNTCVENREGKETHHRKYPNPDTSVIHDANVPSNQPLAGLDVVEAQKRALQTTRDLLCRQRFEEEALKTSAHQTYILLCKDFDYIQTSIPGWTPSVDYHAHIRRLYQYETEALQKKHESERLADANRPTFQAPPQPTMYRRNPLPSGPQSSYANAQSNLQPVVRDEGAYARQIQHSTTRYPAILDHKRFPPLGPMLPVNATNYQGGVSQPSSRVITGEVRPTKRQLPDPAHVYHGSKRPRQTGESSDAPIAID
ncbi:hypothetical protein CcaCcLH18_12846 [Colletotrichum camelliae]|nr:hypothetical protein CcaCcLH18_12846 [Colletotrichum camelliae]